MAPRTRAAETRAVSEAPSGGEVTEEQVPADGIFDSSHHAPTFCHQEDVTLTERPVEDMSVDEESDEETGAEDGEEGVPHGRAPVQHVIGRVGGLGHVLLQRLVRVGDMSNSIRGSDIIGALFGGSDDIFRHYEDLQMELAMQLSIQENPDYLDDMSYERLASLEDVKCTTKEETLANFKTTTFCSRRLRSNGREAHEEDWKCAICQMEYEQDEELLELPCSHSYHANCVTAWLREHSKRCPTCRAEVE